MPGSRMDIAPLLLVIYSTVIGSLMGSISGLVPGIHVNTLALMLLSLEPYLRSIIGGFVVDLGLGVETVPLMVSSMIVSAAVVHSFLDFIPSIFLGAPDASDALSVLPGHRMLMSGNGLMAVRCSAKGSLVGALLAIIMATPLQMVMGPPVDLYRQLIPLIPLILLAVLIILLISERGGGLKAVGWAFALVAASGLLGHIVLNAPLPLHGLNGLGQSLLFPLLTGLFGVPTLLTSLSNSKIPEQVDQGEVRVPLLPSIKGVLAGCLVGWFPGITSTSGAVIGSSLSRKGSRGDHASDFITTVSAVGSSAAVFSLVALSAMGKGRTGAMLAVAEIMGDDLPMLQQIPSMSFALLLLSVLLSAAIGYQLTLASGKAFARMIARHDMVRVGKAIILLVVSLVLIFNGIQGLLLLAVSTLLGLVPLRVGVGRVHLTGCLLVPIMLFFIG
jgi:putative membrane protein